MNKSVVIALCLACYVMSSQAQDFKGGGHVAYSLGGNVAEKSFGGGAQFNAAVNDFLSLDIAATVYPEENKSIDGLVGTFALSARVGKWVADGTHLYVGAGPNLNLYDTLHLDPSIGYHACVGSELTLGRGFEFIAEYRYSVVDVDNNLEDNFGYRFGLVRLGITYLL